MDVGTFDAIGIEGAEDIDLVVLFFGEPRAPAGEEPRGNFDHDFWPRNNNLYRRGPAISTLLQGPCLQPRLLLLLLWLLLLRLLLLLLLLLVLLLLVLLPELPVSLEQPLIDSGDDDAVHVATYAADATARANLAATPACLKNLKANCFEGSCLTC